MTVSLLRITSETITASFCYMKVDHSDESPPGSYFTKYFFNRNINLIDNSLCSHPSSNEVIAPKFYT